MKNITIWAVNRVKALRLAEVILMSGFFMIGCFFNTSQSTTSISRVAWVFTAILFYILAVYSLNSYTDYEHDKNNGRLHKLSKIRHKHFGILTVLFLFICFILFYTIKPLLLVCSAVSFLLWVLYYMPQTNLKASYFGGTIIHFIAEILHFHLGYLALNEASISSGLISVYFALLLSAGHLHHELLDIEADRANGIKTTSVRLGMPIIVRVIEVVFVFSLLYWIALYLCGVISLTEMLPFALISLFIILGYSGKWNIRQMMPLKFRLYYRLLFLLSAIGFVLLKLYQAV